MSEHIFPTDGASTVYVTKTEGISNCETAREEIIRCKECRYMTETIEFADGDGWSDARLGVPFCEIHHKKTMEANFCAWAKRRES